MWWFAALHANLLASYERVQAGMPRGRILDAGCGTGGLLAKLAAVLPGGAAIGLDADEAAAMRARDKSGRPVCAGSVNQLPFADGAFAAIFSADVLCHAGVDERRALAQFRRVLGMDGVLVLNLPAYPWLLSRHDVAVANVRRYTLRGVADMLSQAGFRVLYASYWNTLLFPLMVATRKLLPAQRARGSDVAAHAPAIEAVCRAAARVEQMLLRRGLRLGFGGSILVVSAKKESAHG